MFFSFVELIRRYMKQCWLIIKGNLWYSIEEHFGRSSRELNPWHAFGEYTYDVIAKFTRGQWVKCRFIIYRLDIYHFADLYVQIHVTQCLWSYYILCGYIVARQRKLYIRLGPISLIRWKWPFGCQNMEISSFWTVCGQRETHVLVGQKTSKERRDFLIYLRSLWWRRPLRWQRNMVN